MPGVLVIASDRAAFLFFGGSRAGPGLACAGHDIDETEDHDGVRAFPPVFCKMGSVNFSLT
jgi:hypothetical protein